PHPPRVPRDFGGLAPAHRARPGRLGWCGVSSAEVTEAVSRALAEDLGEDGDLTAVLIPENLTAGYELVARQRGVLAGSACAEEAFHQLDPALRVVWHHT